MEVVNGEAIRAESPTRTGVSNNRVDSIEVHVLDHVLGRYRPHMKLEPTDSPTVIDVPFEIEIDWSRLDVLAR